MAVGNQTQLLEALRSGKYEEILGTAECVWLELKRSGYDTMAGKPLRLSNRARYEFSKDVAALANKKGGVLLLGVQEELSPSTGVAVADSITAIKVAAINLAHYKDVLMAQIYPVIDGVTMTWYLTDENEKEGMLAIVVPKRKGKHHIVRNPFDDDGKQLPGVAIPERMDDRVYIYTAEAVHGLLAIHDRLAAPATQARLVEQREIVKILSSAAKQHEAEATKIRIQFVDMNSWSDEPVLTLQAVPLAGPSRLDSFYDELKQFFIDTKPLRSMGFNLNSIGRESDTVNGAFVKNGIRDVAIRLDPNGTTTLTMKASSDFLGWAVNRQSSNDNHIKINSIVLVEVVFEFARFINTVLTKYGLSNWKYCVDIRNFKKNGVVLYEGGPSSMSSFYTQRASSDDFLTYVSTSKDYPKDTFSILTEIYAFFAFPPKAIPYSTDKTTITDQDILNLNNNINGF